MNTPTQQLTIPQAMEHAVAAYRAGQLEAAAQICSQILAAVPDHFDAVNLMGAMLLQDGQPEQALGAFQRAVAIAPDFAEAHNNLGAVLHRLGRSDEALQSFKRALDRKPGYVEAIFNRGLVFADQRRWSEALACFQRILVMDARHAGAHASCGNVLVKLGRWDEALRHYDKALDLRHQYPEALSNRSVPLKELGRLDDALASTERALQMRPDQPEAVNYRGAIRYELGRFDEAMADYRRAVELRPDYAEAHLNQAVLHMLRGELALAWPLFEWRKRTTDAPRQPSFAQPRWTGVQDISGQSILVHADEGFGDTIQYSRYVPLLAQRGARVVFAVPPQQMSIFAEVSPVIRIVPLDAKLPDCDYHCPLLSLPLAFATTMETIPPPLRLRVSEERIEHWRQRLGPRTKMRIGVAWSGNPLHPNDRNRSIALARLEKLFSSDAEFHSVQKQVKDGDKPAVARFANLRHWGDALSDFEDTAALIDAMDLVVTVDTSPAHVAGSLGKETWILLPQLPDCRWLLGRDDTPWYPGTLRLFRQPARGDWESVIAAVDAALRERPGSRA